MEQLEKFSWLDEYLLAVERAIGLMDLATLQPMSWRHFDPLIAKEWVAWFAHIINEREKKNIPYSILAKGFSPDMCREHLFFTLEDLKVARTPRTERLRFADFFYQVLKAQMPQGDLFGLGGTTRRHTDEEISAIRARSFALGTPEIARELGKLYNGAYNLGAALYLDFFMGKAVENFGPYKIGENRILVVKEMRKLRPTAIWPDINACADTVTLYAVYEGVSFSTDLIACHTQYTGDTIQGLREFRLERDGTNVTDLEEIRKLGFNLGSEGSRQWISLLRLPEPELLRKSVRIRCFCMKELAEAVGLSWEPTSELLGAVEGKTLAEGWKTWKAPPLSDTQAWNAYWRKLWDPREEFYP